MEKLFINRTFKTGDSLVLVVPAEIRRTLLIARGDYVVWCVNADLSVTVRRVSKEEIIQTKN